MHARITARIFPSTTCKAEHLLDGYSSVYALNIRIIYFHYGVNSAIF